MTTAPGTPARPTHDDAWRDDAFHQLRGRTILLATDASAASLAAVRVAAALAREHGALPRVVRAFDTTPVALPHPLPEVIAAADALVGAELHAPDVRALRAELASQLGTAPDWPVAIGIGTPAGVIVRDASHTGAALVVMGLRRHGVVDRVLRDETTLDVMRAAPCPVLGVTPELHALPRRAIVGVDFGAPSVRAARLALALLGESGTLVLVYVEPAGGVAELPDAIDDERVSYAHGVDAAFNRLVTDLAAPTGVTVDQLRLTGDGGRHVAEQLRAVTDRSAGDLIAVGSRRHDWLDRAIVGSVTTDLARAGEHSLLVTPPPPAPGSRRLDT